MGDAAIGWRGTFDAAHFIPGHAKCGRLHGHTYHVTVNLRGRMPDEGAGYLVDYGDVKRRVHALDHRLLIAAQHPDLAITGEAVKSIAAGGMVLSLPGDAVALLPIPETSAEHLAAYLAQAVLLMESRLDEVTVTLNETPNTEAVAVATRPEWARGT